MGAGEVADMNEIANRRAVGRGIVRTVDVEGRAQPQGRLDRQRHEVRFRGVNFTDLAIRIGPGRVEIAQGYRAQPIRLAVGMQYPLREQFRFAIRIHRALGLVFGDRQGVGNPIRCAARRKHDRPIPASSISSNSASDAETLFSKYVRGCCIDSPT